MGIVELLRKSARDVGIGVFIGMSLPILVLLASEFAPVLTTTRINAVSTVLNGFLTLGLLVIYIKISSTNKSQLRETERQADLQEQYREIHEEQTDVMDGQKELMEMQHDSQLVGAIGGTKSHPKIIVRNIGAAGARNIQVTINIGDKPRSMRIPVLSSGGRVSKRLVVAVNDSAVSQPKKLLSLIERGELAEEISIELLYTNRHHTGRESTYTIDLRRELEALEGSEMVMETVGPGHLNYSMNRLVEEVREVGEKVRRS